ncbi:SET and MYND domain-containing protein 4, partial [Pseudolycoriella hygida]
MALLGGQSVSAMTHGRSTDSKLVYLNIICISEKYLIQHLGTRSARKRDQCDPENQQPSKMLWQKTYPGPLYSDLLGDITYPHFRQLMHQYKGHNLEIRCREQGHSLYAESRYERAIGMYNRSACFAYTGTDTGVALAYYYRSMCFLKLKMFEECLNDVRLVRTLNYPEYLTSDLNEREQTCIIESQLWVPRMIPKLRPTSENGLEGMSDAVIIEYNWEFGRMITATRDLAIGETVMIEKNYIHSTRPYHNIDSAHNIMVPFMSCNYCAKYLANLVPCRTCASAMFCSQQCEHNSLHSWECNMDILMPDFCDGQSLTAIIRSIFIAINTFESIALMMRVVEHWLDTNTNAITQTLDQPLDKYRTFFMLKTFPRNVKIHSFRRKAYYVFHAIMGSNHRFCFPTLAHQRFLTHLIFHHTRILRTNAFSYKEFDLQIDDVALIASHLNHSCVPNVCRARQGHFSVIKTILPIRRGEQLFLSYVSLKKIVSILSNRETRISILSKRYGFRCQCLVCDGDVHSLENEQIRWDPEYSNLLDGKKKNKTCLIANWTFHAIIDATLLWSGAKTLCDNTEWRFFCHIDT